MHSVRDTATAVLRDLLASQPTTAAKVTFAWRIAAGPALARAADTSWTSDGILRLTPVDAAWRRELTRARAMLVDRLASLLGPDVVRAITIDTVSESEPPPHA